MTLSMRARHSPDLVIPICILRMLAPEPFPRKVQIVGYMIDGRSTAA